MCRYIAYLGTPVCLHDLVYEPSNGLAHQAIGAMESSTRINADGFGLGWYNPEISAEPALFKDITPAWNSANLRSLAGCVVTGCVMAHVRAATRYDPVTRSNCHPFQHGRLLWMHNGDIPGRGRLLRNVVARADDTLVARIGGNTDSELAFLLYRVCLGGSFDHVYPPEQLASALEETIRQIAAWQNEAHDDRPLALNFCVTDGHSLVATRFATGDVAVPTLHYCVGGRFVCDDGICRMEAGTQLERCAIVASERLSSDPRWVTIEEQRLVVVANDLSTEVKALGTFGT